jgi:hypothetical protein
MSDSESGGKHPQGNAKSTQAEAKMLIGFNEYGTKAEAPEGVCSAQTNSMIEIGALSPRRGPILTMRVYPPPLPALTRSM